MDMDQIQNPNYWKVMCSALETENQSLRKKIKLVVRLIRQQNKKLKRFNLATDPTGRFVEGRIMAENSKRNRRSNNNGGAAQVLLPQPIRAFQLLPEELWVLILDEYVKDPDEIFKMCAISAQINGVYKDIKWRLGFHKVFPPLLRNLDQSALLNLRLTCKKWKNVIDAMLESHNSSFTLCHNTDLEKFEPTPGFHYPKWRKEHGPIKIFGISQLTKFIKELEDRRTLNGGGNESNDDSCSEENPFVGRAVHFSPRPADSDDKVVITAEMVSDYWQHLLELLTQHGKHIYQLYASTGDAEMQSLVFYRHLRVCLDLVPNLRVLRLEGMLRQARGTYCELRLRIFRETHKLPELVHLKCLDINTRLQLWVDRVDGVRAYHEEKHVVLNQLVLQTYATQMETLFYRGRAVNPNSVTEYPQQLPNVKELNALCSDSVGIMFLMREVRLPLMTTLRVYVPEGLYVLRELFLLLKRCPQLSRLEFGETQLLITDDLPQFEPAPSVRYLHVGHSVHVSYNYLVCLPNLEYLGLCITPMTPEEEYIDTRENHNEVVKVRAFLRGNGNMYQSNVWKMLPNLRVVDIFKNSNGSWKRFTREQFEGTLKAKQAAELEA